MTHQRPALLYRSQGGCYRRRLAEPVARRNRRIVSPGGAALANAAFDSIAGEPALFEIAAAMREEP